MPRRPATQKEEKEAPPSAADEKSKTAAMVQQAFDAGIKAYGAGKNEEALRAFEAAIRGGLPSAQMPRMLYYRGLVFRKLGKPGFAVSDLTSALWLKNGLSDAERADAIKMRALAFNEAGISDAPAVPQSSYAEAPALPGQSTPAPGTQTAMAGGAPRRRVRMRPQRPRPRRARAASAASSRICSAAARRAKKSRRVSARRHRIDRQRGARR